MTYQHDLFSDGPQPFEGKTDTSREAAAFVAPLTGNLRIKVLNFIKKRGDLGATLHEIADGTGLSLQTVCARRKELEEMGFVKDSGSRRKNPSGRTGIIWIAEK